MIRADAGSKLKGLLWLIAALVVGGVAALGVPFVARHVPWSVEKRLAGLQNGPAGIEVCDQSGNQEAAALLAKVVGRVYPIYPADREFPIQVQVIKGKTVNAFAFLGGRIFIYEGLLKQAGSAEELAGILAHEIEHVKRRHIIQGVFVRLVTVSTIKLVFSGNGSVDPKLANMLLNMHFSREQEQEADQGALQRLHDARVDVAGFKKFFERAENMTALPAMLSDHPNNDSRARLMAKFLGAPSEPIMSRADWQLIKTICQ
jgi:beta-barrel assembly-enhancing protease